MDVCFKDGKPAVKYAQIYVSRKKVVSLPVCLEHLAWALGLEKGQKPVRDFLGKQLRALNLPKGAIPRVKVSDKR